MTNTKEKIMSAALKLFSRDGYEAVSVSMIADKLGITKGALYRHYENKRHIFDCIVKRMEDTDFERAEQFEVPEGTPEDTPEAYKSTSLEAVRVYSKAQFRYWTEDSFASAFRRMLTLEQYRSPEMSRLYQQYLAGGPLGYMTDIFAEAAGGRSDAAECALAFYAPFFMLYSLYDAAGGDGEKTRVIETADRHIDGFIDRLKSGETKNNEN